MKYALLLSAALCLALGQAQSASAQSPGDLVKQAVDALGGADALRGLKTAVSKGTAKHWEPGQSYSVNGEARFLGDSNFTLSADIASGTVRIDWDRVMTYLPEKTKYSEITTPTYGAVIDDKGQAKPMSSIRLAATLREPAAARRRCCCRRSPPRKTLRRSRTRSSTTRPTRRPWSLQARSSTSCCSTEPASCRWRCARARKTTSGATRITTWC
jgi:hypothetical protein